MSELKQLLEQAENDSTTTQIALEDRLAAAIENLSAATSERDQIRDQMNALTKNLAATGEDLKNAKDLIATLTEKNRLLESDGASQKQELDDLNNVYGVVQSERNSLRDKLAEALLNLTKSDTELGNARKQSDQLILDLQALRSTAEQTVEDVETRLVDALASLMEAQKERAELKANLQRLF